MQATRPTRPPIGPAILPPVVKTLLVLNCTIFALQIAVAYSGKVPGYAPDPMLALALWPFGSEPFGIWQLLTYGFLHGSPTHLFFNMFALWIFGRSIEDLWGSLHFGIYYLVCVVGAGLVQLLVAGLGLHGSEPYPTLGASGGVFGILLAYGLMFPNHMVMLIFPPVPMRAKYFVIIFGVIELWLGVTAPKSTVAHFAHLGGMLFGLVMIQYWRGKFPWKPKYILRR